MRIRKGLQQLLEFEVVTFGFCHIRVSQGLQQLQGFEVGDFIFL